MITLLNGDARTIPLADQSVHCVVTSPPYWGLRSYSVDLSVWGGKPDCEHEISQYQRGKVGNHSTLTGGSQRPESDDASQVVRLGSFCHICGAWRGCLGLEPTPELYVEHIVACMREVWRVLRDDGTLWLNLGDSYSGSWGNYGSRDGKQRAVRAVKYERHAWDDYTQRPPMSHRLPGLKSKDLVGIPWMVAFALQSDGWYLRSDIIWSKPNPMPESVTDRPTKSHEYVFLLSKSEKYFYDQEAIKENAKVWTGQAATFERTGPVSNHILPGQSAAQHRSGRNGKRAFRGQGSNRDTESGKADREGRDKSETGTGPMRNRRSVWTVATTPYSGAHFATFPPALVEPMILAGTSARGCCPACGAQWIRVTEKHFQPQEDVSLERGVRGADGQKPMAQNNHWQDVPRGTTESVTHGWIPTCSCYGIAVDVDKIEIPDEPEDSEPPFVCEVCGGTGLAPSLPMFPDDRTPCPECDGNPIREGNAIWHEWQMEIDEIAQAERLRILKEIEGLDLPTVPSTVLDPFAGTSTVGRVCAQHGRRFIGVELNPSYIALARERTRNVQMEMHA